LWRNSPIRALAASFLRFLDNPQLGTHSQPVELLRTSDQIVAWAATYTIHNKHKGRKSVTSVKFEPAVPQIERPTWPPGSPPNITGVIKQGVWHERSPDTYGLTYEIRANSVPCWKIWRAIASYEAHILTWE